MWKLVEFRGVWCVARTLPGGTQRISLRTKDRDEAQRRYQDFIVDARKPLETVAEILDAWKADKAHLKSQQTIKFSIQCLKPHFGHLRPDQVNRESCRTFLAQSTEKGKKPGTVRRELDVLRAALHWHDKNTVAVVEKPPAPSPKDRYLTREEFELLLSHARTPHVKLFIILALSTAARASALLELTWERVDFERGLIVLAKGDETTKRRATVPMTGRARKALEEAFKGRTSEFVIEYAGAKVGSIIKAFKRTAAFAGLKDTTPHVLRHTAAVWMAESGVPMSEISQFLGHTNTRVTERVYARYSPSYLKRAASALE